MGLPSVRRAKMICHRIPAYSRMHNSSAADMRLSPPGDQFSAGIKRYDSICEMGFPVGAVFQTGTPGSLWDPYAVLRFMDFMRRRSSCATVRSVAFTSSCCRKLCGNMSLNDYNICAGSILRRVFSTHTLAEIIFSAHCTVIRMRILSSLNGLCFHFLFAQTGWRAGHL